MKKSLAPLLLLVLLIAAFRGGTWYSQRWAGPDHDSSNGERRILHYVDPMNPANVSENPGIAPCGMPMEPVYDDGESAGSDLTGPGGARPPGTVKLSPQKQQIIGVQVGTAERISETHEIRTLGRIAADDNRVYPLVSAADGWMTYIPGSTVGARVEEDQLMALIRIYSYDFFSWQQRFLTELANTGRRRLPATNFTGARQPFARPSHSGASKPDAMSTTTMPPAAVQNEKVSPPAAPQPAGRRLGMPFSAMQSKAPAAESLPPGQETDAPHSEAMKPAEDQPPTMPDMTGHDMHREDDTSLGLNIVGEDDILYANKGKLELLNLGVSEIQLKDLAQSGKYVTAIEIRSPVTGLVIDRGVSPLQKVERGTECFRVADLSRVWILADVYHTEAGYIQPGMTARVSLPRQNTHIEARVSDVLPEFDATTRTLKVRLEMDNPKLAFRPEMFVDVEFLVTLPSAVTVPADAVLDSGRRKIVFVVLGDGYFEPREIVTGWRFGDRVEVVKGLAPEEPIVISGNFLIDSESRMKLAVEGLMAKTKTEKGSGDNTPPSDPSPSQSQDD